MKLKRLSADEFDRLLTSTGFEEQGRAILRAVLVDGRGQADVARDFGVSRQRVNRLMSFFKEAFLENAKVGNALIEVTIGLPESLALELVALMNAANGCNNAQAKIEAFDKVVATVNATTKKLAQIKG